MPWACSRRVGPVGALALALLVLELMAMGFALPATAQNPWRLGAFPVGSFLGYSSHYGSRLGPGGSVETHQGLDIAAPLGSAIYSWWGGMVQEVIRDGACGVGLVVRSGSYEHIYCHLAGTAHGGAYRSGSVLLLPGQGVRTGQLIGHVGLSGRTTGPHLHWGVRHQGRWLDPARLLRAMAASRRSQQASKSQPAPRVGIN